MTAEIEQLKGKFCKVWLKDRLKFEGTVDDIKEEYIELRRNNGTVQLIRRSEITNIELIGDEKHENRSPEQSGEHPR